MAEAIAKHVSPNLWVDSAGTNSSYIRPQLRVVLDEMDIDHRFLRSKDVFGVELEEATQVIVLCEPSEAPRLPKRLKLQFWGIPDPLCAPSHERQEAFLECRDTLLSRIKAWIKQQDRIPTID